MYPEPYFIRNEPIITPKKKKPEKELESFLRDIEEAMRDFKMISPIAKALAYVVVFDSLMQFSIGKGCSTECIIVNECNVTILMNTALWKKKSKEISPQILANQKIAFEEWLILRINLRKENFNYVSAMLAIQKKFNETIQSDEALKAFKGLSDRIREIV